MLAALQAVDEELGAVETEAAILQALVSDLAGLATRLRDQRDEALAGRDEALAVLEQILAWSETEDPAAALRWLAAMLRDTAQADLPAALHQLMHGPATDPP